VGEGMNKLWTITHVGGPADGRVEQSEFLGRCRKVVTRGSGAYGFDTHTYVWQSIDQDLMTATAVYAEQKETT
jgi:hypothetical protein